MFRLSVCGCAQFLHGLVKVVITAVYGFAKEGSRNINNNESQHRCKEDLPMFSVKLLIFERKTLKSFSVG